MKLLLNLINCGLVGFVRYGKLINSFFHDLHFVNQKLRLTRPIEKVLHLREVQILLRLFPGVTSRLTRLNLFLNELFRHSHRVGT